MSAVRVDDGAREAYGLSTFEPVGIVLGLTGERLRVNRDGTVDELLRVPCRRWSASADPNARVTP